MSEVINLKRGLNIKLKGNAEKALETLPTPSSVALKPTDFKGLTPKLNVKEGQKVRTGETLFHDKYHPEIRFTAPLGGEVSTVNRGDRRKILEVVVEVDPAAEAVAFTKGDPRKMKREDVKEQLLKSGLWPFLKQRPYGITASPEDHPGAIFISTFDTSPLAPDTAFVMQEQLDTFQTGIDALATLTDGELFLGVQEDSIFRNIRGVKIRTFSGPHPAGNVGIQIHHTAPVLKGNLVWTIGMQDVLFIGRLFETGKVDLTRVCALTGPEIEHPKYYQTTLGAVISSITGGKIKDAGYHQRIISGNVLTGTRVNPRNYLGFFDTMITVIPEGDEYEPFGWATPGVNKFSASNAFLSKLFPKKAYTLNANLHGGERAFVLTDQYKKVLPMDIYPVFLLKAILAGDIDKMEQLGIYEVIEEDMALCEYVCISKIKVQDILGKGINTMIKELGS